MKILVLQHIECETPGYIKDLMLADGFDLTTVELDIGEKIPEVGQTILGTKHLIGPGGKGSNQAIAAARLGGNISFILLLQEKLVLLIVKPMLGLLDSLLT